MILFVISEEGIDSAHVLSADELWEQGQAHVREFAAKLEAWHPTHR